MGRTNPSVLMQGAHPPGDSTDPIIRAGVIGLGYFGAFHAEKYATLPGCELVAVADRAAEKSEQVAMEYDVQAFTDYRDMIGLVDAVSIVTQVSAHYQVAKDFIEAGVHVLVEKAFTETPEQAQELISLAREKGVTLQVGHLERFNPTFVALPDDVRRPTYIETHRLTRFRQRASNVSVVLDLMIHDIDLVLALTRSPVCDVQAKGVSVYSDSLDLVNAVIQFKNGAVANLTASRISTEPQRSFHLFQPHAYTCLDMQGKSLLIQRKRQEGGLDVDERRLDNEDTLRVEVASFLQSVRTGLEPSVTGEDGLHALETAMHISEAVTRSLGSGEPLPVKDSPSHGRGHITHDHHPETREPFFSRTSLVDKTSKFEVIS